ncbi:hypothetical protein [Brevibacterium otitidis]|uniref:Glyoxalase-like domain-containing protein n=1 Tax=Brevibacterium otitidis TaxID=53364 RepID=A0ABV5X0J3_9MICO|nr:hypothetical protein GCM10023233_17000 [Brevibacterium otitidis]
MAGYPCLKQVVLDAEDVFELAEFYRQPLGLRYPPGRDPETCEHADPIDWLNLISADGRTEIAIQLAHPCRARPGRIPRKRCKSSPIRPATRSASSSTPRQYRPSRTIRPEP